MERRSLLRSIGATLGVTGCTRPPQPNVSSTTTTPAETETTPLTTDRSNTSVPSTTSTSAHTSTASDRTDDLKVENYDDHGHCLTLRVSSDSGTIVSGEYRVEARRGLMFSDVGGLGKTYTIEVGIVGRRTLTFLWSVTECPETFQNTDGIIRIRDGAVRFSKTLCTPVEDGPSFTYTVDPESADCG